MSTAYGPDAIQRQVERWQDTNWPADTANPWFGRLKALKVAEECGEVAGAAIKYHEGRLTWDDVQHEAADAVIALMGMAAAYGFDLWDAVTTRWLNDVRHRGPNPPDWTPASSAPSGGSHG